MTPFLTRAALAATILGSAIAGYGSVQLAQAADPAKSMEVWKSESCGCCGGWVSYMEQHGYKVTVHELDDVDPVKDQLKVPESARSCHTAKIGNLVVEGHVPVEAIQKVLAEKPKGVVGIAAPGMPSGSPGMDMSDEPYPVVTFGNGKTTLLGQY